MTEPHPSGADTRRRGPSPQEGLPLEELDVEIVEDLDVDEDAEDVRGGTTWDCTTT